MDIFDQKAVLNTFSILYDTREHDTPRARKRYKAFGVPCHRASINYGDYTYNATLPDGKPIFQIRRQDNYLSISPPCVIERKMNLDELAGCFTHSRARFIREFERAIDHGARIYLVCENATWEGLISGNYRSRFHPNAFLASLEAWMVRYNMNITFCKEETSPRLIKEILYRELKERLERGEYG